MLSYRPLIAWPRLNSLIPRRDVGSVSDQGGHRQMVKAQHIGNGGCIRQTKGFTCEPNMVRELCLHAIQHGDKGRQGLGKLWRGNPLLDDCAPIDTRALILTQCNIVLNRLRALSNDHVARSDRVGQHRRMGMNPVNKLRP